MIKVKDGYAKLIGTTYSGSADRVLLSNGGDKAISDFAAASGVVTALGTNGNYVTWTKNGTANNLTVPYSIMASSLQGVKIAASYNTVLYYKISNLLEKKSNYQSTYIITTRNTENYYVSIGTDDGSWFLPEITQMHNNYSKITGFAWQDGVLYIKTATHNNGISITCLTNSSTVIPIITSSNATEFNSATAITIKTNIHSSNISNYLPTVTNYYWANVPVSSTSSTTTTPTFGNTTVNGKLTINGPQNAIIVNSSCKTAYALFMHMINPNMSTIYHTSLLAFGYDQTSYNLGYIGFKFVDKDSKSNMVTIGLHSVDHVLNITGNKHVGICTETPYAPLSVNGHAHFGNSSAVLSSVWKSGIVVGPDGTDKIVATYLESGTNGATVGAHNSALTAWAPLHLLGTKIHFRISLSLKMELTASGLLVILKAGASSNSGLVVGADSTKSNISTSIADQTSMIQIVAGSGGATNSSAIGFHNPGISSAVLEYKNVSTELGYFNFRSDDKTWNVGIGTEAPTRKFQVNGIISSKSSSYKYEFYINPQGKGFDLVSTGNLIPHYATNFGVYYGEPGSGQPVLYANSSMNLGVGTMSPKYKLDVNGNTLVNSYIYYTASNYYSGYSSSGKYLELHNNVGSVGIHLFDDGTIKMYRGGVRYENIDTGNIRSYGAYSADVLINHDTRNDTINPTTYSSGLRFLFQSTGTNGLSDGGNYYGLLNIRQWGYNDDMTGGYPHQLAFTAHGNMWHRIGTSATTWGSWKTILDSSNYTGYTVKKDGTGATGTWAINISGNANTFDGLDSSDFFVSNRGSVSVPYIDLDTYTSNHADYQNYSSGTYNVKRTGYSDTYIIFRATGSTSAIELMSHYEDTARLKLRKTIDSNRVSGPWRELAFTSDIPTVTNYYWANVPVSSTSSTTTSPTFAYPTSVYSKFTNGSNIIGYVGKGGGTDNLYFINYTNSDICISTDNTITKGIFIKTGGNVGIGTESPSYKLDVNGSVRFSNRIYGDNNLDIHPDGEFRVLCSSDETGNIAFTGTMLIPWIKSNEKIDLGIENRRWKSIYSVLGNFSGAVTSTGFIRSGSSDSYVLLGGGSHKALSEFAMASNYVKKAGDTMTGGLVLEIKNKWLNQARLQIGRLDSVVYSDRAIIGVTDGNLHLDAYKNKAIYLNYYQAPGTTLGLESTALVMVPSGNVGIGTASPSYKLHVNGSFYASSGSFGGNAATATSAGNADTVDGFHASSFVKKTGDTMTGALTIGKKVSSKTATWLKLVTPGHTGSSAWCVGVDDTTNNSYLYFKYTDSDSLKCYISHVGCMYAAHFYESSDILLKTNILEIVDSDKMPIIKEFDWKEDNSHSYGLIAQELEEQGYSELVSTKDDGYKTVNYSAALSLIVGKLQVKIKELEKEIENLKKKN